MARVVLPLLLLLLLALAAPSRASDDAAAGGEAAFRAADPFAPDAAPELGADDRSRLAAGEVLVRDLPPSEGSGIGILVMGVVDAPPARVWEVMKDCSQQEQFLPRVSHSAVRDRDGDDHTCDLVVDMPAPLDDEHTSTRQHVRRLPDGGYQRRWVLLPGDSGYLRDDGSWSVHPYGGGQRSLLVNRMDLLPKGAVPEWLVRAAHVRYAPSTFEAIRQRVAQAGAASAP